MTGQTPHLVALREREYAMLERSGDGLFDPRAHGATLLLQISRACPHGYVCSYSVDADRLLLTALSLSLDPPDQSLPIVGPPDVVNPRARFTHAWHRLRVEVPFSGAMLLGRDYLHGHRPNLTAPRYGEVRELVFEVGRVVVDDDMSDHFARYRALEEAVRRGQPDAAARVRAYILGDDELRGRYPFKAHLQRLWEWAQARTRHLGDDAHQARQKVEGPALEAA